MFPGSWVGFTLIAIFLVGAWFYVARARHPAQKQGAAYLIFVVAFSVAVAVIYSVVFSLLAALDLVGDISLGIAVAVAVLCAFAVGRALIRRPPRSAPQI